MNATMALAGANLQTCVHHHKTSIMHLDGPKKPDQRHEEGFLMLGREKIDNYF